jgi:aerobic-type carbon monoxide dehydrogenase small subunit (CoxS/CutS family)
MSVKYAKWILEFSKFYPGYTRRSFVCACMIMFSNKEYDHKRMMDKLEYLSKKICNCPDAVTYLKLLEELYNKHQSVGTRVRFV